MIRSATANDAPEIVRIYNHYIEHSTITFEESVVTVETMADRIRNVVSSWPWLVFEESGRLVGYAYATEWNGRCAYRYSAESSIYLDPNSCGRGIGLRLYQALLALLYQRELHTVIGGIALPNDASIALHEKLRFKKVAHFSEVGFKFGRWIDVGYWQLKMPDLRGADYLDSTDVEPLVRG